MFQIGVSGRRCDIFLQLNLDRTIEKNWHLFVYSTKQTSWNLTAINQFICCQCSIFEARATKQNNTKLIIVKLRVFSRRFVFSILSTPAWQSYDFQFVCLSTRGEGRGDTPRPGQGYTFSLHPLSPAVTRYAVRSTRTGVPSPSPTSPSPGQGYPPPPSPPQPEQGYPPLPPLPPWPGQGYPPLPSPWPGQGYPPPSCPGQGYPPLPPPGRTGVPTLPPRSLSWPEHV